MERPTHGSTVWPLLNKPPIEPCRALFGLETNSRQSGGMTQSRSAAARQSFRDVACQPPKQMTAATHSHRFLGTGRRHADVTECGNGLKCLLRPPQPALKTSISETTGFMAPETGWVKLHPLDPIKNHRSPGGSLLPGHRDRANAVINPFRRIVVLSAATRRKPRANDRAVRVIT